MIASVFVRIPGLLLRVATVLSSCRPSRCSHPWLRSKAYCLPQASLRRSSLLGWLGCRPHVCSILPQPITGRGFAPYFVPLPRTLRPCSIPIANLLLGPTLCDLPPPPRIPLTPLQGHQDPPHRLAARGRIGALDARRRPTRRGRQQAGEQFVGRLLQLSGERASGWGPCGDDGMRECAVCCGGCGLRGGGGSGGRPARCGAHECGCDWTNASAGAGAVWGSLAIGTLALLASRAGRASCVMGAKEVKAEGTLRVVGMTATGVGTFDTMPPPVSLLTNLTFL
jgi:hypothetical protein